MATVWEASIDGMTPRAFGNNRATIQSSLLEQFPNTSYTVDDASWNNYSIVADGSGDYLRTRSTVGADSKKAFTVIMTPQNTMFVRYKIMFESSGTSGVAADNGFDYGDCDGTAKTWATGGKLPGLMKGNPGDNTGGILDPSVWSGRQMWRGYRKSDGVGGSERDGTTLSLYYYGQEADGETGLGAANTYWYVGDFAEDPTRFGTNGGTTGTGDGQYGDPRAFELDTDVWIDLLLGYHVPDANTGYFKAWTMVDGVDSTWQEQLHLPNMRYMGAGNSGIDGFLFQNFWGGATIDWRPDRVGYMRYKDFGVYTTEAEAMSAFGALASATPFETTAPVDLAVDVTTPVAVSGTAPDDGSAGYQVLVEDVTNATTLEDYGDVAVTYTSGTETWAVDTDVVVPQNAEIVRVTPRRWI